MNNEFKSCPHCAEQINKDAILCRFCDRGVSKLHFKNCPRCSEMVWTRATFCRYCKSELPKLPNTKEELQELIRAGWQAPMDEATIDRFYMDEKSIDKIFQNPWQSETSEK